MNKINWQERLSQILSTGKNKSYFTAGVTVLFIVVMSIIGVVPAISSLSSQSEDNVKRDKVISNLEKKLKDLKTLTLEQDENAELVDYFNEIMPNGEEQEKTINLLNSMAAKRDVFLNSFNFDPDNRELIDKVAVVVGGDRVVPMYLTIQGIGTKDSILQFIADTEKSALLLNIDNASVNRVLKVTSGGGSEIQYIMNLKLIIYYYKDITE